MTVHQVAKYLENSESLQDYPQSGRPQVIKRKTIKKAFKNDLIQKITFGKDISEISKVSTTKHPVSVVMFGVVVANGEKMPSV